MPAFYLAKGRLAQFTAYLIPLVALGSCTQVGGQSATVDQGCITEVQARERLVSKSVPMCVSSAGMSGMARNY